LKSLSEIAEIIVFTASYANYANAIIDYLDPSGTLISHRLYRDHCTFSHGIHIKDLRRINRSLENLIIVDNSVYSYLLQMENGVPILPYFEGTNDNELLKLLDYLKILIKLPDIRSHNKEHLALHRYFKNDEMIL
jgi:CTD small phosphatase-like protein 2